MILKAVILIGGPQKGTRFRPLSLDVPKPLFPVAGLPMIQHHIEACAALPEMKEILVLGFYPMHQLQQFIADMAAEYKIRIRYLQEYTTLGTAGGIYHFRDQIKAGNPDAFFVLNGDVCGNFPLCEMLSFHTVASSSVVTVMATEATRQQSTMYGCIVEDNETHQILHYVEKPSTFVSNLVNCGVYICSLQLFNHIGKIFNARQDFNCDVNERNDAIQLEQDIMMPLAGTGSAFVYTTDRWWSQIKTAGSAIYANRHYLQLYHDHKGRQHRLATNGHCKPIIIGDVHIHPSAVVHSSAVLGPNVSVGKNVVIGAGVRIRESVVLGNATIQDHSCLLYTIVGWNSMIGNWCRVEGTPCDPNPNKPFAKMDNVPLFNFEGKLNPSITILGSNTTVPAEVIILNSIVLPDKDLSGNYKNEIIL